MGQFLSMQNDENELMERRPPLYNAEDYVSGLKRFCKLTGLQMYLGDADHASHLMSGSNSATFVASNNRKNKKNARKANTVQDGGQSESEEMGLRQFETVTELLAKLKADLNLSFSSFLQEFINESNDGVTLLLDLLKAIQLSQTNITGSLNQLGSRANHVMFKRALSDEFEVLLCLKICSKSEDGAMKLVEHQSGLFTVAVCVMSNYSKSRILSLQLLSRLCEMTGGHKQVSDAISMLRLRFGEPVRFKFLVGMLNSYNSTVFQIACLRFLNCFVETSKDVREKIMVQTELEEAGFDVLPLKRFLMQTSNRNEMLRDELERWMDNYVDVNALVRKLLEAERANKKLREEVAMLKEKQNAFSTVDRLRECCDHLQSEIIRREKHIGGQQKAKSSNRRQKTAGEPYGSRSELNEAAKQQQEQSTTIHPNGYKRSHASTPATTATTTSTQTTNSSNDDEIVGTMSVDDYDLDDAGDEVDIDLDDDDDDDVLFLLPSNISEKDLHIKPLGRKINESCENHQNNKKLTPNVTAGFVSISDDAGSLVTVLATDGYTCITSPIPKKTEEDQHDLNEDQSNGQNNSERSTGNNPVGYSGDSGLSSDSSEQSCSPANNRSLHPSVEIRGPKAFEQSMMASEDDLEPLYAERSVMREETEAMVENERISIDRLRQRFGGSSSNNSETYSSNKSLTDPPCIANTARYVTEFLARDFNFLS